jgi:hypothetical protein
MHVAGPSQNKDKKQKTRFKFENGRPDARAPTIVLHASQALGFVSLDELIAASLGIPHIILMPFD